MLFILAMNIFNAAAQKAPIPYERLDSLSRIISNIQVKMNNKTVKEDNRDVKVGIPEGNFKIYNYNQQATVAYYKNGVLRVHDNIDLTKVDYINQNDGVITLFFPFRSISYQSYKEDGTTFNFGESTHQVNFYYESISDGKILLSTIYNLINLIKIDRGLISEKVVRTEWVDWVNLPKDMFYKEYPRSILAWPGRIENFGNDAYKRGEYTEALYWYNKLVIHKDLALKNMGQIYYNRGDYKNALKYYEKAAAKKNIYSMYSIGYMYNRGEGVQLNYPLAVEWLQKAVNGGFKEGIPELELAKKNAARRR